MTKISKQSTGFRYGKHRTEVLRRFGQVHCARTNRDYKLVLVRTSDHNEYYAIRMYNGQGKFIKQLLFEPEMKDPLIQLLQGIA